MCDRSIIRHDQIAGPCTAAHCVALARASTPRDRSPGTTAVVRYNQRCSSSSVWQLGRHEAPDRRHRPPPLRISRHSSRSATCSSSPARRPSTSTRTPSISNPLVVPAEIGAARPIPAPHLQGGHDVDHEPRRAPGRLSRRRRGPATPAERAGVDHDDLTRAGDPDLRRHPRDHIQVRRLVRIGEPPRPRPVSHRGRGVSSPVWVAFYVVSHDPASACTCATASRAPPVARCRSSRSTRSGSCVLGTIARLLIAGGFAVIPIWVYLTR